MWIKPNIHGLAEELNRRIHGHDQGISLILSVLNKFVNEKYPFGPKPLVIYMIGPGGVGIRTVGRLIADHFYRKGCNSQFVHILDFEKLNNLSISDAISWIRSNVSTCPRSMFIFENGRQYRFQTKLKGDIQQHLSIDFTKSIFLIEAYVTLDEKAPFHKARMSVAHRDEVILGNVRNISTNVLVSDDSIGDLAIYFLPLEREHIKRCIEDDLRRKNHTVNHFIVNVVANEMKTNSAYNEPFYYQGCKPVSKTVDRMVIKYKFLL